jgi:hypothetical protein
MGHGGDLASKKHFNEISSAITSVIIQYNAATVIQSATGKWLIRQKLKGGATEKCLETVGENVVWQTE